MHKHIYISLAAIILGLTAPVAVADAHLSFPQYDTLSTQTDFIQYVQKKVSPSEAKSIARKKVRDADVIDLSLKGSVYKVRMQKKNGRVVDVYVDATTGRVR